MAAQPRFTDQLSRITGMYNDLAYAGATSSDGNSAEVLRKFIRAVAGFKPDKRMELVVETTALDK
jgi:hypothetical protein